MRLGYFRYDDVICPMYFKMKRKEIVSSLSIRNFGKAALGENEEKKAEMI